MAPKPRSGAPRNVKRSDFVPDPPEPTIFNGSPRPRVRRTSARALSAEAPEFYYNDMRPSTLSLPTGTLTDDAMRAAFGHSPLLCTPHSHAASETEIEQAELDRLKGLNIKELLRHFRGEDDEDDTTLASFTRLYARSSSCSRGATFPPIVAGLKGTSHWPSL